MSFLDSPVCRCELMRAMVLTDQTQKQCATEHECPPGTVCPLGDCFVEPSGVSEETAVQLHFQKPAGR